MKSPRSLKFWLGAVALALLALSAGRTLPAAALTNAAQMDLVKAAHTAAGSENAVAERFDALVRTWPGYTPAWRGLWRSQAVAGRYEAAETTIELLLARGQADDVAAMTLGLLRLRRGDRDGAFQA